MVTHSHDANMDGQVVTEKLDQGVDQLLSEIDQLVQANYRLKQKLIYSRKRVAALELMLMSLLHDGNRLAKTFSILLSASD